MEFIFHQVLDCCDSYIFSPQTPSLPPRFRCDLALPTV